MFYKRKTLMLAAALVTALTAGVVVALVTNQTEIERDAFGSAGGRMASSNFDTEFIAGQPTSTETSESANFSETAGFLATADISAPPSPDWSVPITVQNADNAEQSFPRTFGGHPAATDGFDSGFDVVAAPPGQSYYAYFSIDPPVSFLDTDIRSWTAPFDTEIVWNLPVINATAITSEVSWDNTQLPPEGSFFLEETNLGINVNMRTESNVQFSGDVQLDIRYRPFVCCTFEFSVAGGAWYMISLPVVPEDNAVATLFPQAIAAFGWNFNTQTYEVATTLDPGRAYWLLLLQTATVEVCGQPFATYTDNYDQQGWDMIGAVSESSPVVDDPDGSVIAMFGWNEATQTYVPVDPMQAEPKEGYWILVFGVPSSVTVGGDGSSPLNKVASTENLSQFYERFGERPPVPPSHDAEESELESPPLPQYIDLSQNYPNPFNPETVIEYQLPEAAQVKLAVYTILGQKVRTLVDEGRPAGYHRVIWDGTDETGQKLASGVYIYRIQVEDFVQTRKIVLLK